MKDLPREMQPPRALEERVVSKLVAAGLVRRRRVWPVWAAAAAAALVVSAIGIAVLRPTHTPPHGNTYVLLLAEDSAYRPAPTGHNGERVAELVRWADSLNALGEFERAGRLIGPGPIGGLFMIRAADDSAAARIAATCPFHKWGGRVELKRFEE